MRINQARPVGGLNEPPRSPGRSILIFGIVLVDAYGVRRELWLELRDNGSKMNSGLTKVDKRI